MSKKIGFFLCLLWLCSCSADEVYMTDVDNTWQKNEAKKLEFDINDAQSPKNLIFVIRNNNEYPYQNLFLISTLKDTKNQIIKTDTMQYLLAKPNGEWLGNGMGSVKEMWGQYKLNYQFPKNGKYQLEIKHGMRTETLKGIEDIGIKIENVNKP